VTLAYDAAGRLATKTAGGTADTFLYSGSMLVGEYNSAGTILSRYIPGPGGDEAALWYSGAGTTTAQWLHADAQGSTIAWSNATGASLGTLAYDPYGQPSAWSGPRYAYTGQLMLPEARLYHDKARAYSPGLGRFLQTDPAGMAGGVNLYAYAGEDPVNGVDPSGMTQAKDPAPATCVGDVCTASPAVATGQGLTIIFPNGWSETFSPDGSVDLTAAPCCGPANSSGSFGFVGGFGGGPASGGGSGEAGAPQGSRNRQQQQPQNKQRACPGGVVQTALRGLGSFTQAVGNGEQAIGLGAAAVGAAAGIGGGVTGDVPLAGFGVLLFGAASETVAEGEGVSKTGTFLSAAGGDFSGVGPTPLEYLASRIPGVRNLSEPLRAAINQGIDKAAEPISNALGCH